MVKKEIMLLTLCALFIAYVPFTSYHFDTGFEMRSILKSAYGQTPDDPGNTGSAGGPSGPGNLGDPGNISGSKSPDPSIGDNSTNPSSPGDVSSGIGNSTNVIVQNYTSNAPDSTITIPNDLGNSTADANPTQTVPEFPVSILVMVVAIATTVVFYRIKSIKI